MDYHQSSAPRLASTIDECMAEGKHANLLSYLSVGTRVVVVVGMVVEMVVVGIVVVV